VVKEVLIRYYAWSEIKTVKFHSGINAQFCLAN